MNSSKLNAMCFTIMSKIDLFDRLRHQITNDMLMLAFVVDKFNLTEHASAIALWGGMPSLRDSETSLQDVRLLLLHSKLVLFTCACSLFLVPPFALVKPLAAL